jgi:hypothetical protein
MVWILMREGGVKVESYFRFTIKKEKKKGKLIIYVYKDNFYRLWKLKALIAAANRKAKRTVQPRTAAATTPRKSWSNPK